MVQNLGLIYYEILKLELSIFGSGKRAILGSLSQPCWKEPYQKLHLQRRRLCSRIILMWIAQRIALIVTIGMFGGSDYFPAYPISRTLLFARSQTSNTIELIVPTLWTCEVEAHLIPGATTIPNLVEQNSPHFILGYTPLQWMVTVVHIFSIVIEISSAWMSTVITSKEYQYVSLQKETYWASCTSTHPWAHYANFSGVATRDDLGPYNMCNITCYQIIFVPHCYRQPAKLGKYWFKCLWKRFCLKNTCNCSVLQHL